MRNTIFTPVSRALDQTALQTWIDSYIDPVKNILLIVIPVLLAIYLLFKAVEWWQKEAEGENPRPYWVTVKKGVIVGVIAMSVDVLLVIFGI